MRVFDGFSRCPKCGYSRGPETKPLVAYCDGSGQRGQAVCDVPDAEGERPAAGDHLHRKCPQCGYEWSEATVENVPPLTAEEVTDLRAILAEVRKPS